MSSRGEDKERPPAQGGAGTPYAQALALLAGADSESAFDKAVALIERAAADGDAEATAMVATLEAVGAGRPRDWDKALENLDRAAELGSDRARAQLCLLAAVGDWREARGRIDVEQLLRFPARRALSERPRMRAFEGFATGAECRWVMDKFRERLGPAMIWNEATGEGDVDPARTNSAVELRIAETDVVTAVLRARIAAATLLPEFIFEVPQVMHYAVGQEFKPHHDFLDPRQPALGPDLARRGQRMGTFLIFLNDDFEGGETEFPAAGISYRGRAGDALFFANILPDGQPDPLTLHAGRPPTSGEKWIFSQWIRNRPPSGSPG